jgi:hypothetical protein
MPTIAAAADRAASPPLEPPPPPPLPPVVLPPSQLSTHPSDEDAGPASPSSHASWSRNASEHAPQPHSAAVPLGLFPSPPPPFVLLLELDEAKHGAEHVSIRPHTIGTSTEQWAAVSLVTTRSKYEARQPRHASALRLLRRRHPSAASDSASHETVGDGVGILTLLVVGCCACARVPIASRTGRAAPRRREESIILVIDEREGMKKGGSRAGSASSSEEEDASLAFYGESDLGGCE